MSPSSQVAAALAIAEVRGERYSIEFLRAALDCGTWAEVWTPAEGRDYAATFAAKAL